MSYLRCLWEGACLIYVVCGREHVLFTLFVGGSMSYLRRLWEGACLIYVVCGREHVLFTLFVGGSMSYLRRLCLSAYGGVQHILCNFFCFVFLRLECHVLQFFWIVYL